MACASAISATSLGTFVRSAAQSLKVLRKPCTVALPPPAVPSALDNAVSDNSRHFLFFRGHRAALFLANMNEFFHLSAEYISECGLHRRLRRAGVI